MPVLSLRSWLPLPDRAEKQEGEVIPDSLVLKRGGLARGGVGPL